MIYYVCIQENCPTCSSFKNHLNCLSNEYLEIKEKIVYVENDYDFFKKNVIMSFPTTIIKDNDQEIDRFYGDKGKDYLIKYFRMVKNEN